MATMQNYKPRPKNGPENGFRALNTQRARGTDTFKGITNSPLDNDLFELKTNKRPVAIHLHEQMADFEIAQSQSKREFFSPKQYQTIIANFDLSNLNAKNYSDETQLYEYPTNDSGYYGNTFAKVGLEKVFKFDSGSLSMPRSANFDQSRLFVQVDTSGINMGNFAFNYMFALYPDSAESTPTRITYKSDNSRFQLNGYCPLNIVKLQIRDVAGVIMFPDPRMSFVIQAIGPTTTLSRLNHGLQNGMLLYVDPKSTHKNVIPRIYIVTVIDPDTISIPVDTSSLSYMVSTLLNTIIDDYVFNYTMKIFSIREDENTATPNMR